MDNKKNIESLNVSKEEKEDIYQGLMDLCEICEKEFFEHLNKPIKSGDGCSYWGRNKF